jgi:hypothetical protein
MGKIAGMVLPIFSIKGSYGDPFDPIGLQAPHVDAVAVGIGSRNVKRFDAAHPAKEVLGYARVECVTYQRLRARNESESGFWHDEMKKAALSTYRAIALNGLYGGGSLDLKPHAAAMAPAFVFDRFANAF